MVLIAPRQYGYLRKAYVLEVPKIAWASLDVAIKGHDDRLKVANSAAVEGGQKHSREAGNPIDSDLNVAHWDGFEFCRIHHIRLTLNFVRKNFYHLI